MEKRLVDRQDYLSALLRPAKGLVQVPDKSFRRLEVDSSELCPH